jgi:hypothetical protein
MSEFKGRAGTIYIEKSDVLSNVDLKPVRAEYEVWFEDFCILGTGDTEVKALDDAWRHTGDIMALIADARIQTASSQNSANGLPA